ncbi:MAG: hypothetical protein PUF12_01055 [Thermoflexaceae bacterium]|nr:hypothetical protein [Thermoflexaceae bacterium]
MKKDETITGSRAGMILPVWITYYCIYMNRDDAYVLLEYLVITVLGNLISGSAAFFLRKMFGGNQIVYILIFMLCMLGIEPFAMWF